MQRLIVMRHGYYTESGGERLAPHGIEQMKKMGGQLNIALHGGKTVILTSTAPRAKESAAILGEILGVVPEEHEILWSDRRHETKVEEVLALIGRNDAVDNIILVTHCEYTEELPNPFGKKVLGVTTFPWNYVGKGQAWFIDCMAKTCTLLDADRGS